MLSDYYEIDEVGRLIGDLDEYNREALKLLENGDLDAFSNHIHEFMKLQLNQYPAYERAVITRHFLDKKYIIQFHQDFDLTTYFDEIVRTRSDKYKDSEFYYIQDEINGDLEVRLNSIQACLNGEKTLYTEPYNNYMNLLDQLHSFQYDNSIGAIDNAKKFRSLVGKLISQKKKCIPTYILPNDDMSRDVLSKLKLLGTINYEKALDIVFELANQIKTPKAGSDSTYWIDNIMGKEYLNTEGIIKYRSKDTIEFARNAIKNMGIDENQYKSYFKLEGKNKLYRPNKKFVLGLALYLEIPSPNNKTSGDIISNIERFMNMHSYSLSSPFETLSDDECLLDYDILYLIDAGLDIKVISYFMKNFARSRYQLRKRVD